MHSDLSKKAFALLLTQAILFGTQGVLFAQQGQQQAPISNYFDTANGTSVEQLVRTALARNAELLAGRQRITEAQGLLRQSGFRTNPSIDVSVGNGRILGSPGERDVSLGYSHVFELGGKRERRVEVSEIGVQLAQFEVADRERLLRAELQSGYAEALAAVRSLEIVDQQLQLNQETLRVTGARVQQGEAPPLDQSLIQVEVGRLQSDRILFENQLQRAILALKPLVGMNVDEPVRLTGDLRVQPVAASLSETLAKALSERPDLQAARIEEKLRDAETRSARAEAVPNVIASGRYSHTNSAFDQLGLTTSGATTPLRDADNILTGGISIVLPLRNRNQGLIQAAIARTDAARLHRQFVEQVITQEVRSAYGRYQATQRALVVFDQSVLNRSADNVRIIQAAFNAGELRLFDVINEQRRLTDTQRAYTDVLRQYYIAVVELERAVGAPLQ